MRVVKEWSASDEEKILAFLKRFENTSLFLLSNLENYGPHLGEFSYSGNYKYLLDERGEIRSVFCLNKGGGVLCQTDKAEDYSAPIFQALLAEGIAITSCLGEWESVMPFWSYLQSQYPNLVTTKTNKEVLYTLSLPSARDEPDAEIKFLEEEDFLTWERLNIAYCQELGFPLPLTAEARYREYVAAVQKKYWWGLFGEGELRSIAAYNARYHHLAQLGGVYTLPAYRGRGLSKRVVRQMIRDSFSFHSVTKLIFFTQEENWAARKVYESQEFRQTGTYGIFFGQYT